MTDRVHDRSDSDDSSAAPQVVQRDATKSRDAQPAELHPIARLPDEWITVLQSWGERPFRARQVFRWIHARGVTEPTLMTDLSKSLRARLKEDGIGTVSELDEVRTAADGTRKLLLRLSDGRRVECVLIPMTDGGADADDWDSLDDAGSVSEEESDFEPLSGGEQLAARIVQSSQDKKKRRVTLCVSTQHGCAMGCVFCASGRSGLGRGLGAAEIVGQVLEARRHLASDELLTNLVFMGMGEPLHHYDETARAIRLLSEDDGVGLGLRRMTVSTVGLVRGIERLGRDFDGKVGLAISLHAPNDELRSRLVPMNERIDLATLIGALQRYPLPRRRRITIEYILIANVNDTRQHAQELGRLLRPLRVKVNLISMNPVEGTSLLGSSSEHVSQFRDWVASEGYSCFVRTRRGDEVSAACGQLALRNPSAPR
ncbi:MAG TPA: 23S rRNA (adenine(2503)-C(2))-methyltransferase RlmN [Polyangiaceae bacterium]|nr:23S rRNA (adenine(2503)-C(2))-methyltransferase RlmN [Polyangiaceae bacterium]